MLVLLAACSRAPDRATDGTGDPDAPGVDVTAAPGVAFHYAYGFRLPGARIAAVQEAHAAACERLGVARCRITRMDYRRGLDNQVGGELDFRLSPDLARAFGRDGIRAVEAAEGMVLAAEIAGEDAGADIDRLSAQRTAAAGDRAALSDRAAATDGNARTELERQRAAATETARQAAAAIADRRAALAATPVTFRYEAGPAIRNFDAASPLTGAADLFVTSARWTLGASLAILGTSLPPLLLALLILAMCYYGRGAWRRQRGHAA
jgi:hypothetical protein